MKSIKRLITVMAVLFALFNLVAVQSKAAEWSEEEVIELVRSKINKARFDRHDENMKLEADIREDLIKDRAIFVFIYAGIVVIINIVLLILMFRDKIETSPVILALITLTILPVYALFFNGYPSNEDIAKEKAKFKIEDVDSEEFLIKTTKEVVKEIYSSGDIINNYSIEEATEEITRKIGISEGKVLK